MKSDIGAASGLTLLELMVVLVILSMLSTVLYQSAGFLGNVYERVIVHLDRGRSNLLVDTWVDQTITHVLPIATVDDGGFTGDESSMSMTTTMPLDETAVARIHWRILADADGSSLIYEGQNADPWLVMRRPGRYYFRYQDKAGLWHDRWPPVKGPIGVPRQLLIGVLGEQQLDHYVQILSDWLPPAIYVEI